jgi:recombinase
VLAASGTLALGDLDMPKHRITPAAQRARWEAVRARANRKAAELAPVIAELRAAGIKSLSAIAAALNARGVRTPLGHRHWYASQVASLLARLAG